MHDIEKQLVVERLYAEVWQNYAVVYGNKLPAIALLDAGAKAVKYAGRYWPKMPRVEINTAYYDGTENSATKLRETIAHELAHHITYHLYPKAKQWHGPEFKSVMQSIGYGGNTYHTMSVAKAKQIAKEGKNELFKL